MGIVNITPDSFSGDGILRSEDRIKTALTQALAQVAAGADIIDIGGESTRPGSEQVSESEEMHRVIPVIEALRSELSVPISIDTYKSAVAREAIAKGANLVNDVWGLRRDPEMAKVVAAAGVSVILMHNRSQPQYVQQETHLGSYYTDMTYRDLLQDIQEELRLSLQIALESGIPQEKIILDPGIGFGKTVEQNLELIHRLGELKALGYPLLVGPSRKSFIGKTLNLPPDQRLEGTAAAITIAIDRGADLIRVHDVEAMVRVAQMVDAIVR
jgi:dihydropteroate synthase